MRIMERGNPISDGDTRWVVYFSDGSAIGVDVAGAVTSEEKTFERIKWAARLYSDSHPDGVISSVMINLRGERIN
jgi:hypothetical protein